MTTVTLSKFFAALRSMDGPPMSMFSMQVSKSAPLATVFSKAYRFTTTMSIIWMPCSAACAMWSGLPRLASRPPCTRGCSVFTRPSIISGNCVTSSMGVTGTPASLSARAVPPVEMISAPNSSTSARAKSATPVLSVTDTSTRFTSGLLIWPYILSFGFRRSTNGGTSRRCGALRRPIFTRCRRLAHQRTRHPRHPANLGHRRAPR